MTQSEYYRLEDALCMRCKDFMLGSFPTTEEAKACADDHQQKTGHPTVVTYGRRRKREEQ